MASFYGNYWGGNGGGSAGAAANIIFIDSSNDLPAVGEEETLYVTLEEGIFIYKDNIYYCTTTPKWNDF